MNNTEFENLVSKFLERAKVVFLKKGTDYEDNINYPTYIILDEKRTTFYLTESATNYENFITTESQNLSANSSIDISLASSFLQLGKDNKNYTGPISLNNGVDISSFTRKSAILIQKEVLPIMEEFLNSNSIAHQAASLEDVTVLFLNESSNDKLIQIYNDNIVDDIQPIYTPKDDVSVEENLEKFNAENQNKSMQSQEDILDETQDNLDNINNQDISPDLSFETSKDDNQNILDNAPSDQIDNDTKQAFLNDLDINDEPSQKDSNNPTDDEDLNDEELAMLNNLDLDDLLKPMNNSDDNSSEQDNTVYGHVASEQDVNSQNIFSADNLSNSNDEKNIKEDKNKKKEEEKERKKQLKEEKLELKKAKKEREKLKEDSAIEKFSKLDVINNVFAKLMGIIFFLPLFIFNKIFAKVLPPFIIYWAVAIITVFLGYLNIFNEILSYIPKPFENLKEIVINNINELISINVTKNIESLTSSKDADLSSAIELVNDSLLILKNQTFIFDYVQNNLLLVYLISLAAILMIFPAFRTFGKSLTIFSVLYYFAIPMIYYIQYIFIKNIIEGINVQQIAIVSMVSAYIIPLLFTLLVFIISYLLVPNNSKRKGILP